MRIGLLKLTDAAPVIMAQELELFAAEGLEVDAPGAVVDQRVLARLHRFHVGQEFKQRIRRARHQHLVAGVRQ